MPPYPGRLFHHPDYSLLLKYFPESDYQWPKNPDYQKILEGRANEAPEWIISVEMNSDKRKAFWEALRHPYGSYLKEETRPPEEISMQKKLIESRDLKPIEFDGTYRLIYSDETTGTKNDLNLERYLSTEKDFSAELFAIHSFLNYQVKIRINPLRRFPVLSLAQIEKWHKKPDFTTHREELNSMVEIKLQGFVPWAKKGLKNSYIASFQASDVDWVKKTFNPQPFLTNENQIRKNLCRGIERFLEQEKVCINTEGNQILGAFLVFSSGLSFRNQNRDIWQKFDQDLKDNFRQCTKHK